jgi:RimJ/RimL family protein N-acetyltransferase
MTNNLNDRTVTGEAPSRVTSSRALMRLHVETLFTMDDRGRLVSVNQPGGGAAPRFFLGRTTEGNVWAVRHDVDRGLAAALEELLESEPAGLQTGPVPASVAPYVDLLSRHDSVQRVWTGPAYGFPSALPNSEDIVHVTPNNVSVLTRYFTDWLGDVSAGVPMTAFLEDEAAVSICCSVRMTQRAHEVGVETHRDFRGRGHAARVVAGWARAVRDLSLTPLYSTSWENQSSQAVAKRLGLVQYGADLHVT